MKITRRQLRMIIESTKSLSDHEALESITVPVNTEGIKTISILNSNFNFSNDDLRNFKKMYYVIVNISDENESVIDEIEFRTFLLDFILNVYTFDKDSKTKKAIIDFYKSMRSRGYGISPFMLIGFISHIAKYYDYSIAKTIHEYEVKIIDYLSGGAITKSASDLKNYVNKNREKIIDNLIKYLIPVSQRVDLIVDFTDGHEFETFIDKDSYNESLNYFRKLIPKFTETAVKSFSKAAAIGVAKKSVFPIQQLAWEYLREAHTLKITRRQLRKLISESIEDRFNVNKSKLHRGKVGIVSAKFQIVDDESGRKKGLMFRQSMPKDEGMLFIHDSPDICGYYMKNTYMPLTIAYADDEGTIFQIEDMTPGDLTSVMSIQPALYALEMNQGWFDNNDIKIGDMIEF